MSDKFGILTTRRKNRETGNRKEAKDSGTTSNLNDCYIQLIVGASGHYSEKEGEFVLRGV